ncbi:MAG: hypothetical protein AB7I36_08220 [Rhodospirillaceae bacterium]
MTVRASLKFGGGGGIHFKEPWQLMPATPTAANLIIYDAAPGQWTSATTGFFTEMARRGLQDQTNWTADTYKTLLSVTSGKGFVAAIVGPTLGGAHTTTFRITVDGVVHTIAIVGASGDRCCLLSQVKTGSDFTTSLQYIKVDTEALASDKATLSELYTSDGYIPGWRQMQNTPMLQFKRSLLIEAKNSASITNSTATAYSAVMYRLGL